MKSAFVWSVIATSLLASGMFLHLSSSAEADDTLGLHSLRALTNDSETRYVRHFVFRGSVEATSRLVSPEDATFKIVRGLADERCYSFQSVNYPGYFLRHSLFALMLHPNSGDGLFKREATFCKQPGRAGEGVSFTAFSHPDRYLRHSGPGRLIPFELWLDPPSGPNFAREATFHLAPPTAGETYLMTGDSITHGFPLAYLPGQRDSWENRGVPTHQTTQLLGQIPSYSLRAKKIFLLIGINDFLLNPFKSPAEVAQDTGKIIAALQQKYPDTPIVVQSVLPVTLTLGLIAFPIPQNRVSELNRKILDLNTQLQAMTSQKNGLQYLDLHSAFVDNNGELRREFTDDGLHLTEAGYQHWAEKLQPLIQ